MADRAGGYTEYRFTAEFYDYIVPYRERHDVAFWVEMAQVSGGPVLEIGCGTGRVLIPTARGRHRDQRLGPVAVDAGDVPGQPGRGTGRGARPRPPG